MFPWEDLQVDRKQVGDLKQGVQLTVCLQILSCSPLRCCGAILFSYSEVQNYFVTFSLFLPVEILELELGYYALKNPNHSEGSMIGCLGCASEYIQ